MCYLFNCKTKLKGINSKFFLSHSFLLGKFSSCFRLGMPKMISLYDYFFIFIKNISICLIIQPARIN